VALDVTVAGPAANSYITVAEADLFAADRLGPFATKWLSGGLTSDQKENALITATRDVDAHVGHATPFVATQRLLFPRDIDYTGTVVLTPFLHRAVKEATFEQAIFLASNADILDQAATRRAHGLYAFNNPDGTGGSLAVDPNIGTFSPLAHKLLVTLAATGLSTVRSVPMRSLVYLDANGLLP
jgi:hypothetical protein